MSCDFSERVGFGLGVILSSVILGRVGGRLLMSVTSSTLSECDSSMCDSSMAWLLSFKAPSLQASCFRESCFNKCSIEVESTQTSGGRCAQIGAVEQIRNVSSPHTPPTSSPSTMASAWTKILPCPEERAVMTCLLFLRSPGTKCLSPRRQLSLN